MAPKRRSTAAPAHAPAPAGATAGAPASLLQLVQQLADADDHKVAPDLARDAKLLIDAAWDGTMCESIKKRKITLPDAIKNSTPALDAAAMA